MDSRDVWSREICVRVCDVCVSVIYVFLVDPWLISI